MKYKTPERRTAGWLLENWFRLYWVLIGGYALYSLHAFIQDFETAGDRWMMITHYLHQKMEEHDAPLGDLPNRRPQIED